MRFDVDVDKLIDNGININDLLFCHFVCSDEKKLFDYYIEQFNKFFDKESIDKLIGLNLLELDDPIKGYIFSNIKVTDLFIDNFLDIDIRLRKATKTKSNDSIDWFEEWYSLWPKGIKSGEIFAHSHLIAGIS